MDLGAQAVFATGARSSLKGFPMAVSHATRRSPVVFVLASILSTLPWMAPVSTLAAVGVPSRLVVFVPDTVYVDHSFDVFVWIADDGKQLVKDGTSATVTLTVAAGPGPPAVLACPAGLTVPSMTTGPNAGLAVFTGCTADRAGDFALTARASNVVSTIVPTPSLAPDEGVPLRVLPAIEAPQESITLTPDSSPNPYAVLSWGESVTLRVQFTEHGANRSFELQESPRTTSTWRAVANLVTDQDGAATYSVRPRLSTLYRVVYAGGTDLAAGRSTIFTALVRAVARQRPIHKAPRVINRGTTIRFTTTIRPVIDGLAPMKVGFQLYHRVVGRWRLASLRTRTVDATGVARINITFGSAGEWYVRSYAKGQLATNALVIPDAFLVALGQSEPTPIARFSVR